MSERKSEITKIMGERLPDTWVKTRQQGGRTFSYVPIDKTVLKLNQSFGDEWDVVVTEQKIVNTAHEVVAIITVRLRIKYMDGTNAMWVERDGIGADTWFETEKSKHPDLDKMVKTAYADAIKKATNMFGFGSQFWDESNVADTGQSHEATPQVPAGPTSLSEKSKEKISVLLAETGLTKEDLSQWLGNIFPESKGVPIWLAHGNEDENVDKFTIRVREELTKAKASK